MGYNGITFHDNTDLHGFGQIFHSNSPVMLLDSDTYSSVYYIKKVFFQDIGGQISRHLLQGKDAHVHAQKIIKHMLQYKG